MMGMTNDGYDILYHWELVKKHSDDLYKEITRLTEDELHHYSKLMNKFERVNKNRSDYDTQEKGDILEDLVSFIFKKTPIFNIKRNIRTSTNEIDQLIILNNEGMLLKELGCLNIKGEHFICECKNYDKKIDVTWVGKFYSLLNCSGCRLGILFSYHGFTGKGWNAAKGLSKKLHLTRENVDNRMFIIDFNINHFNQILKGSNFLDIIKEEMINICIDTDLSKYITVHPSEEQFDNADI